MIRVSPPVLPIQFGIRNELMPILRQGIFIQFESSQKMNGVFVALLLREVREDRIKEKILSLFSVKDVVQQYQKRKLMVMIPILIIKQKEKKIKVFNFKQKLVLFVVKKNSKFNP